MRLTPNQRKVARLVADQQPFIATLRDGKTVALRAGGLLIAVRKGRATPPVEGQI